MAIARQQTQIVTSTAASATITYTNFAVGSGTDRTLVACVVWRDDTGSSPVVNSVAFNTTENFTHITGARAQLNYATDNYMTSEIWTLDNPSNSTANVVATLSEPPDASDGLALVIIEYTGANNGTGGTPGTGSGNSSTLDVSMTTNNSDSIIVSANCSQVSSTTFTTTQTELIDQGAGSIGVFVGEMAATGGSDTFDLTSSVSRRYAHCIAEINAAAGAGPTVPVVAHNTYRQLRVGAR